MLGTINLLSQLQIQWGFFPCSAIIELDSEHFSLAESKMFTFSAQGDVDIELEKRASLPITV